jgi:hypothetical protein
MMLGEKHQRKEAAAGKHAASFDASDAGINPSDESTGSTHQAQLLNL